MADSQEGFVDDGDLVPSDIVPFGLGQPDKFLIPNHEVCVSGRSALEKVVDVFPYSLQYGKREGSDDFLDGFSSFLSTRLKSPVDRNHLAVTAGTSHALGIIAARCRRLNEEKYENMPGSKEVIVETPTYFLAENVLRDAGLKVSGLPRVPGVSIVELLETMLKDRKERNLAAPALIYIIPTYHNPCGTTLNFAELAGIARLAEKYDTFVCADEPYNLLNFEKEIVPHYSLAVKSEKVISLGTFSKLLAPGLRVGYAIAHSATLRSLYVNCGTLSSGGGVNPYGSHCVTEMIKNNTLETHIETARSILGERMNTLKTSLFETTDLALTEIPDGGYFAWVNAGIDTSSPRFSDACKAEGVTATPGSRFLSTNDGHSPQSSTAYNEALSLARQSSAKSVRLSVSYTTNKQIVDGVHRLVKAIRRCK